MEFIKTFTVTKNNNATVTVEGEIPYSEIEKQEAVAITTLSENLEIDGFRKGHVPEKIAKEKIGEAQILAEMAEKTLAKVYPTILKELEIDAVGYPEVSVKKLAPGNPFGFSFTVATMPTFELPDYKKIAATHAKPATEISISEEEVDDAIKNILERKQAFEKMQKQNDEGQNNNTDLPTPETVNTNDTLPELTDDLAKEISGLPTVDALKEKIKEELTEQKTQEEKNKHRATITDALVEATEITVPEVFIQAETDQFMAQMKDDLTRAQISFEDYLKHIKKTEEELVSEWRPNAEKRAKVQLILNAIADNEKISPNKETVLKQVEELKARYKDADNDRLTVYVESILRNDAVMQLLEKSK